MYAQGEESEEEDDKVLMKRFFYREFAQKQVRFEEGSDQVQDQIHVLAPARITSRPVFTPKEKPQKKTGGLKKNYFRPKWQSKHFASVLNTTNSSKALLESQHESLPGRLQMEMLTK